MAIVHINFGSSCCATFNLCWFSLLYFSKTNKVVLHYDNEKFRERCLIAIKNVIL